MIFKLAYAGKQLFTLGESGFLNGIRMITALINLKKKNVFVPNSWKFFFY
jgi:hypothetical protein